MGVWRWGVFLGGGGWRMICPADGRERPISALATVDLPEPDSPTMPRISPGASVNETPFTASYVP